MAAPDLSKRQNDVPKCEDGQDPPSKGWRTGETSYPRHGESERWTNILSCCAFLGTDCQDDCYMKEGKDGDNKNNVCKGMCMNVGHPAPVFACRGE